MEIIWNFGRMIYGEVADANGENRWGLFACYGTPYTSQKRDFWENYGNSISKTKLPWLLFGDLNEIMNKNEKLGGRQFWRKKLYMKPVMQNLGAIDLGFHGKRFTWENNQEGKGFIKERLDRAFADEFWLLRFPTVSVAHLVKELFDHCPILISMGKRTKFGNKPFRFLQAWTTDGQSH